MFVLPVVHVVPTRATSTSPGAAAPPAPEAPTSSTLTPQQLTMRSLLARVVPFPNVRFGGTWSEVHGAALEPLDLARDMILMEMNDRSTAGLTLTFEGRVKSYTSTWRKLARKRLPLERVYDVRGLRIVVDNDCGTREQDARAVCYSLREAICYLWEEEAAERDDYVLNPKASGY